MYCTVFIVLACLFNVWGVFLVCVMFLFCVFVLFSLVLGFFLHVMLSSYLLFLGWFSFLSFVLGFFLSVYFLPSSFLVFTGCTTWLAES